MDDTLETEMSNYRGTFRINPGELIEYHAIWEQITHCTVYYHQRTFPHSGSMQVDGTGAREETMATARDDATIPGELRDSFRGNLIRPGDPEFDDEREIYNAMIDKRPQLIAKCTDVADVIAAVNYARENDIETGIRSGGHNGPGLSLVDDGLVIDLSEMNGI